MEAFLKLNNFLGAINILCCLNLACIQRLKRVWKEVPKKIIDLYKEYDELLSPLANFHVYRKRLNKLLATSSPKTPIIPYLGLILRDLIHIEDGNPELDSEGNVNVEKTQLFQAAIDFALVFQQIPFVIQKDPNLYFFLLHDLESCRLTEEELYQLSISIFPPASSPRRKMVSDKSMENIFDLQKQRSIRTRRSEPMAFAHLQSPLAVSHCSTSFDAGDLVTSDQEESDQEEEEIREGSSNESESDETDEGEKIALYLNGGRRRSLSLNSEDFNIILSQHQQEQKERRRPRVVETLPHLASVSPSSSPGTKRLTQLGSLGVGCRRLLNKPLLSHVQKSAEDDLHSLSPLHLSEEPGSEFVSSSSSSSSALPIPPAIDDDQGSKSPPRRSLKKFLVPILPLRRASTSLSSPRSTPAAASSSLTTVHLSGRHYHRKESPLLSPRLPPLRPDKEYHPQPENCIIGE